MNNKTGWLLLLCAVAGPAAQAQVHRCIGADGKVSFSDTLCNGERAQKTFGSIASARGWTVEAPRQAAPATGTGTQPVRSGMPAPR